MKRLCMILFFFLLFGEIGLADKAEATQKYPLKPITVIIPMEAGSDQDVILRPLFERVSAILGKPLVVVNKPGAAHTLGYWETHRARPDGYTIGTAAGSLIINKMQGLFPYDYHDFTLLGNITTSYPILFSYGKTQKPLKSIQEIISFAKAHPGEVSMATTAIGGPLWISAMLFQEATGLKFNLIPQEGSAGLVVIQVAGGHSDLGVTGFSSAKPQVDAGNIRYLATMGTQRYPGKYNEVPTLKEIGYNVNMSIFSAVIGPPKLPKEIKDILVRTFETAAKDPDFLKHVASRNSFPFYLSPEEFYDFCDKERPVYQPILDRIEKLKGK